MKISIFGLGYVGTVSAGCLANDGHDVIGVDSNLTKVELINCGRSPIVEREIDHLIDCSVSNNRLRATISVTDAIENSILSIVCVGTPSLLNGSLDLRYVRRVCEEIGESIKEKDEFHVIVIRSTMLPGATSDTVIPALEMKSGKVAGKDFGVCFSPEFLREGSAVYDFNNPPKTVVGESDRRSGDVVVSLSQNFDAPLIRTDLETAEMVKYADNVWHALKVCFSNEIGDLCKELGIDSHKVMDIFCKDTKLNLSPYYMKPGFAYGGSCLPKDVRALTYKAKILDLDLPILNAIHLSNEYQINRGIRMIIEKGNRNVSILGFSFKAGTDDLRESPMVEVIERLIGKGFNLRLYDENVNLACISGANRDYILNRIPHISCLMSQDINEVINHGETILVGNKAVEFEHAIRHLRDDQVVVDFVRISETRSSHGKYDGICW